MGNCYSCKGKKAFTDIPAEERPEVNVKLMASTQEVQTLEGIAAQSGQEHRAGRMIPYSRIPGIPASNVGLPVASGRGGTTSRLKPPSPFQKLGLKPPEVISVPVQPKGTKPSSKIPSNSMVTSRGVSTVERRPNPRFGSRVVPKPLNGIPSCPPNSTGVGSRLRFYHNSLGDMNANSFEDLQNANSSSQPDVSKKPEINNEREKFFWSASKMGLPIPKRPVLKAADHLLPTSASSTTSTAGESDGSSLRSSVIGSSAASFESDVDAGGSKESSSGKDSGVVVPVLSRLPQKRLKPLCFPFPPTEENKPAPSGWKPSSLPSIVGPSKVGLRLSSLQPPTYGSRLPTSSGNLSFKPNTNIFQGAEIKSTDYQFPKPTKYRSGFVQFRSAKFEAKKLEASEKAIIPLPRPPTPNKMENTTQSTSPPMCMECSRIDQPPTGRMLIASTKNFCPEMNQQSLRNEEAKETQPDGADPSHTEVPGDHVIEKSCDTKLLTERTNERVRVTEDIISHKEKDEKVVNGIWPLLEGDEDETSKTLPLDEAPRVLRSRALMSPEKSISTESEGTDKSDAEFLIDDEIADQPELQVASDAETLSLASTQKFDEETLSVISGHSEAETLPTILYSRSDWPSPFPEGDTAHRWTEKRKLRSLSLSLSESPPHSSGGQRAGLHRLRRPLSLPPSPSPSTPPIPLAREELQHLLATYPSRKILGSVAGSLPELSLGGSCTRDEGGTILHSPTSFKMLLKSPRSSWDGRDQVVMDGATYRMMRLETTHLKLMLYNLQSVLQQAETLNPFDSKSSRGFSQLSTLAEQGPSEEEQALGTCEGTAPGTCGSATLGTNDETAKLRSQLLDAQRQILFQRQQLEERDKTIRLLQSQMTKYASQGGGGEPPTSCRFEAARFDRSRANAATQTERLRAVSTDRLLNAGPYVT
ncbi:unnamed protein product [Darwinula stevensoni]|uniref:Uncharacterized protein n=1 Tax=Darwinula stevensoni TaxID=69355 RepID=A0A7R9ABT6_9CRUS|nr:unnamed protein product [Darwinula stevensoni]CAG0899754.1 unnamed protein product [Darwinula stevensoni]